MHAYKAYLEQQADRIEAVLASGKAPVHITGGTIGPEWIRFQADPAPHIRFAAVQAQQARLCERLGFDVTVTREPEGIIIKFPTPPKPPLAAAAHVNPADVDLYSRAAALEF